MRNRFLWNFFIMELKFKYCKLCGNEYKRVCDLSYHVQHVHDISPKEYYDRYLKEENEGICPVCGKETNFWAFGKGYYKFCSTGCINKSKEIQNKIKNTMLKRYGKEHALQVDTFKEKQENTVKKLYGAANYFASEQFIKDNKEYNLKNFGVEHNWQRDDIKNKIKTTKKERYGSENYVNIKKCKETKLLKYGDENFNNYKLTLKTRYEKCISKYDILANNQDITINSIYRFGIKFTCNKCHMENDIYRQLFKQRCLKNEPVCIYCNPVEYCGVSNEETELLTYIKSIYTGTVIENTRDILSGKELDMYLPDKKLAIEFDGLYWHNELNKDKDYHLEKTEACEKQGIQLIHIFEDEWLYRQDIVKSRIKGLLGLNKRIFARKCEIRPVDYKDSEMFLNENHIQGNCMSSYRYGLYSNSELVSLMTFGKSRFNKDEYELLRFCNKTETNVVGGASRLFNHFLKDHPEINEIISFADRRWSVGNLYEKLGFMKDSVTPPAYFYIINGICHNRLEFQKHKLVKEGYNPTLTEHEIMLNRNIYRIYDCGNLKYRFKKKSK